MTCSRSHSLKVVLRRTWGAECLRWVGLALVLLATAAPARAQSSIFPPTAPTPIALNNDEGKAVEVGMKFRASVDGLVTAARFYKQAGNTGTHIGHLWSSGGSMLAEAAFTSETASGWQEVAFASPVAITANTTYIISYWSSLGNYSDAHPYFTSAVVNAPLRALADGEDGWNGVYVYATAPAFPDTTWLSSNYWVDLVFTTSANPAVSQTSPTAGAMDVSVATSVTALFNMSLDPASIGGSTFQLRDASNALVSATVSYDPVTHTATLAPGGPLAFTSQYTATLTGGASGIKNLAGNPMEADYVWSFTTATLDQTPPTVTSTSPSTGATGVAPTAAVSAVFSEALSASTVNATTFELRDAGNALVAAIVSYDVFTHAATLTPSAPLAYLATYTATLQGGAIAPHLTDLAGNALAADYVWSFTTSQNTSPEPAGWYAGDPHVHRSCGGSPVPVSTIYNAMVAQDVDVVSLLADMGNAEVQDPITDLPLVNGQDDPSSTAGRIIHWDAEWHWDATYTQYAHQALGGHLLNLGLTEAHQIWDESTYPIMQWAHQQGGISGFAHMAHMGDDFPTSLGCCTPVEYPVEVALGAADFIEEDVSGGESAIHAYYRLLNCGFRPGLAAGTDYPCGQVIGPLLTYGQVAGGQLTYRGWIDAIARGRTVVSRAGSSQFLALTVNGTATPGDEIQLTGAGDVSVSVAWTAKSSVSGTIELVSNGVVVASKSASAAPGAPDNLTATVNFPKSGWLCARVMNGGGHVVHTAAVFVTVAGAPVRASATDAQFYVDWMDNLLTNTSPGGSWNSYFPTELAAAQARYQAAKAIYQQIAAGVDLTPFVVSHVPASGATAVSIGSSVTATFSQALDASTVTTATFLLKDAAEYPVAAAVTYDAGAHAATLTPSSALVPSTIYTATLKGGTSGIKDPAGTALAADVTWSFTTEAPDLTAPTVSSTVPVSGAGGVAPSATVNATFGEALSPSTVSTGTFELRDATNALVPAAVSYSISTHIATLTPTAPLAVGTYSATLKGGATDPRIKDLAGNALAADYGWSFTVSNSSCPCTIWSPSTVPVLVTDPDTGANELGVKFRAAVNGYITGIRFYKSATNTGTHVGNLWTRTGTLLASATFTGESGTGWQEVSFGSPVSITASTTYVASYHTNTGHYSNDDYYFTAGIDAPPLRALGNGEDGPNGVYALSATSVFPTTEYRSTNYWVDVVFATSVGPDLSPPVVVSHVPATGATAVAVGSNVTATFNEAIDPATLDGTTFELRDAANALVTATVTYDAGMRTATLDPASVLAYSTLYTAKLKGGLTDPRIKDLAGNALAADVSWSFTSADEPPPPPTEGPGGPILVISAAANPFSRYFVEILRAEGLNEFMAMDISQVTPTTLTSYDVVILGEMSLTAPQVTMFTDWTNAGGTLVASRPDAQLAGLLGITRVTGSTLADKYLLVNTVSGPGVGIVAQTIQFHGTADLYTLNGATSVATLYSTATTATSNPAVTLRSVGSNGGKALAFTYDLARSVVYTRQGNPAWAGQDRDGQGPRAQDMFYGNMSGDPQPDWIDLNKVAIPQADEQQRLLANAITLGNLHRKPLPRFWYFPKLKKAVVIMTGDDEGSGQSFGRWDRYIAQSPVGCSSADWECVRGSSYIIGISGTDAQAQTYTNLGFELGAHVNTGCTAPWTPATLANFYSTQLATFRAAFPSIPAQASERTHCIAWCDWDTNAHVQAANNIRLDTNYYYWPPAWVANRPGYFTGSGMVMRFADLDGTMVDNYQSVTQIPDESGLSLPYAIDAMLDKAIGAEGYYGAINCNMHTTSVVHSGSDAIVASAQARGIPIVSGRQMAEWLDGRNGSSFGSLAWSSNALSFTIVAAAGSRNMKAMLPTQAAVGQLTGITRGGTPVVYTTETIKGIAYAFFPADAGSYVAQYGTDTTPPAISAITATPHGDGTATITWTTNEASDSRVDYGTTTGTLGQYASDATPVTSHSILLSGLAVSTTYYYRVTSADAANNAATAPVLASDPLSFATPGPTCFSDETAAQFAQGTTGTNTYVAEMADGEVVLKPTLGTEFSGTTLPVGWRAGTFVPGAGGNLSVGGGLITVNGTHAYSTTTVGPGTSLEFVATYTAGTFENVGFSADTQFVAAPWVVIGFDGGTPNGVYARSNENPIGTKIADYGASYRYRIQWNAGSFDFYVDGTLMTTLTKTVTTNMYVQVSDYTTDAYSLQVDWLRASSYASSGSFLSRAYDAGASGPWGAATWTADTPTGTSLQMFQHQGNTPVPDGTWTTFTAIGLNGANVGGSSRYLQYRADLATTDATATPVLKDMHIACSTGADVTPPVISSVAAAPGAGGTTAVITWTTDEASNSLVDYGTNPGSLSSNASDAALVASHSISLAGLSVGTIYYYRVTSADASSNTTTQPVPPATLSFTTPAVACMTDQTAAQFAQGTLDANTVITTTGDGEVMLKGALDQEFSGSSLPGDWTSVTWESGGAVTVSGGMVSVDAARISPTSLTGYGPGRALEFVATFAATANQHIGLADGDNTNSSTGMFNNNSFNWVMFSTWNVAGPNLYARMAIAGTQTNLSLGTGYLGSPHLYRIEWNSGSVVFKIDGVTVQTQTATIAALLRPGVSDYTVGTPLQVDWLRVSPYATSGSFLSSVHDGGGPTSWVSASWNATVPVGTSLSMSVRGGNSSNTSDPSWTAYQSIPASGGSVGICSRYVQYRVDLSTTNVTITPALQDVSLTCASVGVAGDPVTGLAGTSATSGNDASGRTKTVVTWSGGGGGGGGVKVYRKGYGNYPAYSGGPTWPPAAPASPLAAEAAGWTVTAVHASGEMDQPPARDYWSYVAFNTDACGSSSAASNVTGGTLDYLLGDVSDGTETLCAGDNAVIGVDVSLLGTHYGAVSPNADYLACLDVGPTVGYSRTGRPIPDGAIEFEELVLFALNFTPVRPPLARATPAGADALALELPTLPAVGESFTVLVRATLGGTIQALKLELDYDRAVVEMEGVEAGELLGRQGAQALVLTPWPGRVDVALLGPGASLFGSGELVQVRFRVKAAGAAALTLKSAEGRDGTNRKVALNGEVVATQPPQLPTRTWFSAPAPNPFSRATTLSFALARGGAVELAVYGVDGRKVATLVAESREPGQYQVSWDGRDGTGQVVRPGLYYARLVTPQGRFTRTLVLMR